MNENMKNYPEFTSSFIALNWLKNEGYTLDFNLKENCLICMDNDLNR